MYIDRFVAGILVTVMVELVIIIANAVIINTKNKNNGGKNNG